ncbi:M15 family metallopeptidase [Cytobacillus kochii]|uniref:M15 family metallopeptidase n=1 Tax=Cytobacillus kochii TaxID=859143 RepID=UPI00402AF3EF
MTLYYQERNLNNIAKLADNTKALALKWHEYLVKNDINILIYETIRTEAKQREYVNSGASQTMRSYHLVGQALDFVPVNSKGETLWNGYSAADVKKAIKEAKRLGFEWGGDWKSFIDKPHLQYNYKGYGTDTFNGSKGSAPSKNEGTKPSNIATSIVDYLKSKKIDSSFSNRKKLAKQYGINDYEGTPEQNILLLEKLQSGAKPVEPSKPKENKPKPKKEYVTLPASAKTWRTYKLNVAPVKKNSDWSLTPAAFGGLTYEILDKPQANVVTIKTSRGKRNIYVGSDTSAKIFKK